MATHTTKTWNGTERRHAPGTELEQSQANRGFDAMRAERAKPFDKFDLTGLTALLLEQARQGEYPPPKRQDVEPYRTCPHCSHHGPIQRDFGWHHNGGKIYPCSWCRKCRRYPNQAKARKGQQ